MDKNLVIAMWRVFYIVALLLGILGAACTVLSLYLIFNGNEAFEASQLILPAVCACFSIAGFVVMKLYKKRIDAAKKRGE